MYVRVCPCIFVNNSFKEIDKSVGSTKFKRYENRERIFR